MDKSEKIKIIIQYLEEAEDIVHKKHHELAQKNNLTVEQFHLLVHLPRQGYAPTISEIAARFRNAQNTMSEKISRLEEKGLVERFKDGKDKRICRVRITEEGQKFVNNICDEAGNQFMIKTIEKMSEEHIDTFYNCLGEYICKLKGGE